MAEKAGEGRVKMCEIKFRAWDKNAKKMIFGGSFIDVSQTPGVDRWVFGMDIFNHPDDVELMRFTGLKDKNGIEIYEGDIVKMDGGEVHEVVYKPAQFTFDWSSQDLSTLTRVYGGIEVIGNIYENPELLATKPEEN